MSLVTVVQRMECNFNTVIQNPSEFNYGSIFEVRRNLMYLQNEVPNISATNLKLKKLKIRRSKKIQDNVAMKSNTHTNIYKHTNIQELCQNGVPP